MRPVPTANVDELDVLPDHPVILKNFSPRICCETIEELLAAANNPIIAGCHDESIYRYVERPSAEVARLFNQHALDFNVTDSYIDRAADPEEKLSIPALIDAGNLLTRTEASGYYRKCLVVTQKNSYTRAHRDPGGMAGWMYLFKGQKRWQFWDAVYAPVLYDIVRENFYDENAYPPPDSGLRSLIRSLPFWEAEIEANDLLYFPGGWVHRVWTSEDSFGYGGMALHAQNLHKWADLFLHDRRLAFNDAFDYLQFIEELACQGFDCESLRARVSEVLEIWKQNR